MISRLAQINFSERKCKSHRPWRWEDDSYVSPFISFLIPLIHSFPKPPVSQRKKSQEKASLGNNCMWPLHKLPVEQGKGSKDGALLGESPPNFNSKEVKVYLLQAKANLELPPGLPGTHACPVPFLPMQPDPHEVSPVQLTLSESVGVVFISLVKYKLRQLGDGGFITNAITNYPCLFSSLTHTHTHTT